jgi:hypothetical protein
MVSFLAAAFGIGFLVVVCAMGVGLTYLGLIEDIDFEAAETDGDSAN